MTVNGYYVRDPPGFVPHPFSNQMITTIASKRIILISTRQAARLASTLQINKHPIANSKNSIAVLGFDRPKAKNAISREMLDELHEYIDAISTKKANVSDIKALILTSTSPDIFCAGADLKERKTFTPEDTKNFLIKLNHTLDLIEKLHIPTVSVVQGLALGGGLEIALSTDFRVLSTQAKVGVPETRLAIIPGAGGTYRLPRLIGYSRALDLVLTGRRVGADEALAFGLANRIGQDADKEALEFVKTICEGGPLAISAGKQAVRGASPQSERDAYSLVVNSKDKFEALDAFAQKRKPVFIGE